MVSFLRRFALALSTGYIFFFFSELVFWSFWRPINTLGGDVATWLTYALAAYVFLILVQHFRVKNIWGVFLAGAAFGWVIEGIIVMTFFGEDGIPFPITISWTGLAWHALLSVLVGWYLVRIFMQKGGIGRIVTLAVGIGLFWGFWANTWTLATPPLVTSVQDFFGFSLVATLFFMVAHIVSQRISTTEFRPSKAELIIIAGIVLAYFCFVTVPTQPVLAPFALLPMFAIVYFGLRKNKQREPAGSILLQTDPVPLRRYVPLITIPIAATLAYAFFFNIAAVFHPNIIVLSISTLVGFVFFVIALSRMYRPRSSVPEV